MKDKIKLLLYEALVYVCMIAVALLVAVCFSSCGASRKVIETKENVCDSVRTEYRYIERTTIDTVFVSLPVETSSAQTLDSVSHLETSLAVSDARIENGVLSHTLTNKKTQLPVEVPKTELQKDSIIYRDREVYIDRVKTEYVDREKTRYEKLQAWWFYVSIAVLLSWLVFKYRKKLLAVVRRFI